MSDLIEIEFEHVPGERLFDLLGALIAIGDVKNVSIQGVDIKLEVQSLKCQKTRNEIVNYLKKHYRLTISVLAKSKFIFSKETVCYVMVFYYKKYFSIEFSFENNETPVNSRLIKRLQKFCQTLIGDNKKIVYFCGLEPATDLETRFFTGNNFGPLGLSK